MLFNGSCRFVTVLAVIALGIGSSSCRKDNGTSSPVAKLDGPNVLLVTFDTTRADRIGCYGYDAAETPHLDGLAASGIRYDRAFTTVPLTLPSHASLLTGLYPGSTSIHVNGKDALGEQVLTMGHWLRKRGFRTGAFLSTWVLSSEWGLAHGFDHYDDDMDVGEEGPAESVQRPGNETVDRALAWLKQSSQDPFFAWVHLFDPHDPYEPPSPYKERHADPYDGEIAFADAQLGRLLEWLESSGQKNDTVIVVAGDHGEGLGDHNEQKHGLFVYDSTMHIPLILSYPQKFPRSSVVTDPVSLVDIFPSIASLLSGSVPELLDGQSLVAGSGNQEMQDRAVYLESEYGLFGFGWSPLRSVVQGRWKFIDTLRPELYDLENDPQELNNILDQNEDRARQLRHALAKALASMSPRETATAVKSADALQKLESLGYVGGGNDASDSDPTTDPKDVVDIVEAVEVANELVAKKRYEQAVSLLEPLAKRSPQSTIIQGLLGEGYLNVQRFKDAENAFVLALQSVPDNATYLCYLGDALIGQGREDDAIRVFQNVLESQDLGQAHSRLAVAYVRKREFQLALPHAQRFVSLTPDSPNAHYNLANVLFGLGRPDEGIGHLRRAIQLDSQCEPCHMALWQTQNSIGSKQDVLSALSAAHAALPVNGRFAYQYAWLLATSREVRDGNRAVEVAQAFCQIAPETPACFDLLGVAYAAKGDFKTAVEQVDKALALVEASGQSRMRETIATRKSMYELSQPYTE